MKITLMTKKVLPLFKYPGGKRKEIKHILEYIPKYTTYFEPFLGGGALLFHLLPEKAIVADNSFNVRNFYKMMKKNAVVLFDEVNKVSKNYNAIDKSNLSKAEIDKVADEYYYHYRDTLYNPGVTGVTQAVRFYILRQLGFSGMIRHNKQGKENVPYGYYKTLKPITHDPKVMKQLFKNISIHKDAFETLKIAGENDFVFLDPPYTRKFIEYHIEGQFGKDEHLKLFEWFKTTKAKAMIILNVDDFTTSLYGPYIKKVYDKSYAIEFKGRMTTDDKVVGHFIATNYEVDTDE